MPTGGIAASLFEAMAVALVKGPEEASVAGTTPESHEQEQTKRDKLCHTDLEHVSLIKADPNAFYGDAACFDHFAARVRFGENPACLLSRNIQQVECMIPYVAICRF